MAEDICKVIMEWHFVQQSPIFLERVGGLKDLMVGMCKARSFHLTAFSSTEPLQRDHAVAQGHLDKVRASLADRASWCSGVPEPAHPPDMPSAVATPVFQPDQMKEMIDVLEADAAHRASLMAPQQTAFWNQFVQRLGVSCCCTAGGWAAMPLLTWW